MNNCTHAALICRKHFSLFLKWAWFYFGNRFHLFILSHQWRRQERLNAINKYSTKLKATFQECTFSFIVLFDFLIFYFIFCAIASKYARNSAFLAFSQIVSFQIEEWTHKMNELSSTQITSFHYILILMLSNRSSINLFFLFTYFEPNDSEWMNKYVQKFYSIYSLPFQFSFI